MRCLLDTHTFLWAIADSPLLPKVVAELLEDESNELFFSVASLWEIAIKLSLDKLRLDFPFSDLVTRHILKSDVKLLGIEAQHLDALIELPFHHRDPFDRLLIAQSMSEQLILLTRDKELSAYPIQTIWDM